MWAVLPVKTLKDSKTRLSPALSSIERVDLFKCMIGDVLSTLMEVRQIERVLIVTRDPEVVRIASRFNVDILDDESDDGYTAAVGRAARWLVTRGADGFLQVPADIPGVTARELADVLAVHRAKRGRAFTIAPSHDGGSNCVVCTPPDVIGLSFGIDSFSRHLEIARAADIECSIVERPGLGLDIDRPEDLANFLSLNSATDTHRFLSASGIARRVTELVAMGREKEEVA